MNTDRRTCPPLHRPPPTFEADFKARLHWSADTDAAIEQRVADILADVQQRGDAAVLEYTARFDGLNAAALASWSSRRPN